MGPAQIRRQTMRVMVFGKAIEDSEKGAPPAPEAFAGSSASPDTGGWSLARERVSLPCGLGRKD
jgi:hypothetical protein